MRDYDRCSSFYRLKGKRYEYCFLLYLSSFFQSVKAVGMQKGCERTAATVFARVKRDTLTIRVKQLISGNVYCFILPS